MSTTPTTRSTTIVAVAAAACLVVGAVAYWNVQRGFGVRSDETIDTSRVQRLSLVVSGDTAGWIVPCGCTSNQSGGLPRRATYVDSLRKSGEVLVADVGGAPGGTSLYEQLKFEAILKGEKAMGLAAHNVGAAEVKLGADYLRRVRSQLLVPFISANLHDRQGKRIFDSFRTVNFAGRRIALVGVLSQKYAVEEFQIADPKASVLAALDEIRKGGICDDLIVLAYLPADELRAFAAEMPEADIVIGGPTGQAIAPEKTGKRWLAAATNKGKFVARFHFEQSPLPRDDADYRPGNGQQKVVRTLADWQGEIVELSPKFVDHPTQQANMEEFYQVLEQKDIAAEQTGFVLPLPADTPADFRIAGTAACAKCHDADCHLWEESNHAHAWETLSSRGAHVDSYCQQCHTTGFGIPGGFQSVKRNSGAVNVGCESCHGPSSAHAARPDRHTPFVARDQCTRCHDRENSPKFDYATYWAKMEHGQPAHAAKTDAPDSKNSSEPKP